jgi:hypothetical protein
LEVIECGVALVVAPDMLYRVLEVKILGEVDEEALFVWQQTCSATFRLIVALVPAGCRHSPLRRILKPVLLL